MLTWFARLCFCWAIVALLSNVDIARAAEFDDLAAAVRTALAQRELVTAKAKVEELEAAAKSDEEQVVAARLRLLHDYVFEFWKSVHAGGQTLIGAEEIVIGDKRVAIVEYDAAAGRLVLRTEGQNKRYTLREMPPRVALTLAEQVLKKGAPQNDAYFGSFLAMDAKGDRKLARDAWERAQQAGVDVKTLLPELDVALPAAATITLPTLDLQSAAPLRPTFWQVLTKSDKGWKKSALGKQGVQNTEGRLEIAMPEEAEALWLVFGKKPAANFGVRMYLLDMPAGQRAGVINEKAEEAAAAIDLPAGLVKLEFARRNGEFLCRINDAEQEVTIADAKEAKASGLFGITLPPGAKCVIAGFEWAN